MFKNKVCYLQKGTYFYLFIIFFLVIGFSVRIIAISTLPLGLNQDEASIGYDAYSILKTGSDRHGVEFPVHLISWGSGQNALYAYLSIPFISVFGLNPFSVRIVNAIFSCISLIFFYLLFKLLFDKRKAIVALAILTICPWSIMSGRWGLECNIFPTLFLIGIYFLIKSIHSSSYNIFISIVVFAVCLYSYGTSYLIVPLFFLLSFPYLLLNKYITLRNLILSFGVFFFISLPIIMFVIINHLNLPQFKILNLTIPRLDRNRTTEIFNMFSPDILVTLFKNTSRLVNIVFLQTDGNLYNAIPTFGTIYGISLPFFLIGLYNVLSKKEERKQPHHFIFLMWFLSSIVLGISSHININRLNIIFFPMLYFVVHGIFDVSNTLVEKYRNHYKIILSSLYFSFFCFFLVYYFVEFHGGNEVYSPGLGDAIRYAENINQSDSINITTNTVNMPYIYVCFYNRLDPNIFLNAVKYKKNKEQDEFEEVEQLGRYTFGNGDVKKSAIQILSKEELKYMNLKPILRKDFGNYSVLKFK